MEMGRLSPEALNVIAQYIDFKKVCEEQQTERERIRACRDGFVEAIRAHKEVLLTISEAYFDERRRTLSEFFERLDAGVATTDHHLMDIAVSGIVGVIQANPLLGLGEFEESMSQNGRPLEL